MLPGRGPAQPLPALRAAASALCHRAGVHDDNAHRHGAPPVRVTGRANGPELVLSVEDAGPGVDPVVLPAVFEPFIHREGVGLGLGLPLSQRLAGAQGARLEHRVGALGGAAFDLVLPLSAAPELDS